MPQPKMLSAFGNVTALGFLVGGPRKTQSL